MSSPKQEGSHNVGEQDPAEESQLECPICLQACIHPVELPCGHIFCYLCIKGVALQGTAPRCAICRSSIPLNALTHPRLKDVAQLYKQAKSDHEWFYEARGGGWWQYDERSSSELEKAFSTGQKTCQLLVAGHLYEVDFPQMLQYRTNNRNMMRRIKRGEVTSTEKRGVAGIRLGQGPEGEQDPGNSNGNSRTRRNPGRGQGQGGSSTVSVGGGDASVSTAPGGTRQAPIQIEESSSDSEDDEDNEGDEGVDSDDSEYSEDEDMDLDDEDEEFVESEASEDEPDVRDGARAPTSRSTRSNSSTAHTPPPLGFGRSCSSSSPSSGPSTSGSGQQIRKKHSARRSSSSVSSSNVQPQLLTMRTRSVAGQCDPSSSTSTSPSPQLLRGENVIRTLSSSAGTSIRLSPSDGQSLVALDSCPSSSSRMSTSTITTPPSGITCLLLGPNVKITLDNPNSGQPNDQDEFL